MVNILTHDNQTVLRWIREHGPAVQFPSWNWSQVIPPAASEEAVKAFFEHAKVEKYLLTLLCQPDKDGNQVLHMAITQNRLHTVRYLIQEGANLQAPNSDGDLPLPLAVALGYQPIVQAFVQSKDGPTLLSTYSGTGTQNLLRVAKRFGREKILLYLAIALRSWKTIVPLLQQRGIKPAQLVEALHAQDISLDFADADGNTRLHQAVQSQDLDQVKVWVAAGADLDAKNQAGDTPLDIAIRKRSNAFFDLLDRDIQQAAEKLKNRMCAVHHLDLFAKDPQGNSLLHQAAESGNLYAAKVLIAAGLDPQAKNRNGEIPAFLAYQKGHPEISLYLFMQTRNWPFLCTLLNPTKGYGELLLGFSQELGFIWDESGPNGYTCLQEAVLQGAWDILKWLVEAGVNLHALSARQQSALDVAVEQGYWEIALYLVEKGVEPTHLLQALSKQGTDLHAADEKGTNLLQLAAQKGYLRAMNGLAAAEADRRKSEHRIDWAYGKAVWRYALLIGGVAMAVQMMPIHMHTLLFLPMTMAIRIMGTMAMTLGIVQAITPALGMAAVSYLGWVGAAACYRRVAQSYQPMIGSVLGLRSSDHAVHHEARLRV